MVGVAGGGDMPLSTSSQCSSHLEHSRKSFNLSSPPDGSLFHFPNIFNAPGFSFFFFFFFFFFVKLPRNFIGLLSFSPPTGFFRDAFRMLGARQLQILHAMFPPIFFLITLLSRKSFSFFLHLFFLLHFKLIFFFNHFKLNVVKQRN